MTEPTDKSKTAFISELDKELSADNKDAYSKVLQNLMKYLGGDTKKNILAKVQEVMTDAINVTYDNKLAPGTYQVTDINNILIAYAWLDEKEELVLIPKYSPDTLSKRVN